MYAIEATEDHGLRAKGLIYRVVLNGFDGLTTPIGYFQDHGHARMVTRSLNAFASIGLAKDASEAA